MTLIILCVCACIWRKDKIYGNTMLAIMTILPILSVRKRLHWSLRVVKMCDEFLSEGRNVLGGLFGIVSYFVNGVASWKINGKVTGYGILYNAKEFWKFESAKPTNVTLKVMNNQFVWWLFFICDKKLYTRYQTLLLNETKTSTSEIMYRTDLLHDLWM